MTMELGSYTFDADPQSCTQPIKKRRCSDIDTLGGVEFFSWGLYIEGQEITMKWAAMTTDQYNSLRALLYADAQIVWNPDASDSSIGPITYEVEIKALKGDFHMSKKADAPYRRKVELKFVIIEEV